MNDMTFSPCPDYPWYLVHRDGFLVNTDTGHILTGTRKKTGYVEVCLRDENGGPHYQLLHRIVAKAFCERPDGSDEVNHINGDKTDNRADNLEWVTREENLRHAHDTGLMPNDATPKAVQATNMDTGEQLIFPSIYKAARFLGISQGNICMCCKNLRPYAGGYYWEYKDADA